MIDWFEDQEDGYPSLGSSWMRLYIVAGLIGFGMLGLIGGMLHVLPA